MLENGFFKYTLTWGNLSGFLLLPKACHWLLRKKKSFVETAEVVQVSEIGYLKWDWNIFWDCQIFLVTLDKTYRKHFTWFVSDSMRIFQKIIENLLSSYIMKYFLFIYVIVSIILCNSFYYNQSLSHFILVNIQFYLPPINRKSIC